MMPRVFWHYLGAFYLLVQSLGATLWWLILWLEPRARAYFRPSDAPDSVLLAFALPDFALFIGAGLIAARRLWKRPQTALLPLALHVGAVSYGALFCVLQWLITGEVGLAALLMMPPFLVGSGLLWKVSRP